MLEVTSSPALAQPGSPGCVSASDAASLGEPGPDAADERGEAGGDRAVAGQALGNELIGIGDGLARGSRRNVRMAR